MVLVVGRYVSQSFGRGGTGGISAERSTSPALSPRSSPGRTSPALGVDEMSLPALLRRYFDAAERVATEVAEVESCEVQVPAVMLAEEDEPRLNGLVLVGKGSAEVEMEVEDEARRFWEGLRVAAVVGMLETEGEWGDLGVGAAGEELA